MNGARAHALAVAAVIAITAGCSSSPSTASPAPSVLATASPSHAEAASTPTGAPPSTTTDGPTPVATPEPRTAISHVVVVWMENTEASSVSASSMPYLSGLAATYGRADRFYAVTHPSLPNYLAFWSGSTHGVTDDGVYNLAGPSLSSQMAAAGLSWRTYAQDYPAAPRNLSSPVRHQRSYLRLAAPPSAAG